jgi:uncharacterized membrane protein
LHRHRHHLHCDYHSFTSSSRLSTPAGIAATGIAAAGIAVAGIAGIGIAVICSTITSNAGIYRIATASSPLRKRAKTYREATRASSRAAVLAKKRQIPQQDGCFSPPSPTSPPRNPTTKSPAKTPLQSAALPVPLAREALTVAGYTAAEGVFATTAIEENAIAASV